MRGPQDLKTFLFAILVVVSRRRIELPAMAIAIADLRAALQFLVIVVLDTERAADVVDNVLIGCRVVAARSLVTDRVRGLPIGVNVA